MPPYKWKVFRKEGDNLVSILNSPLKHTYDLNNWNEASIGGFLVFNSRDSARDFKRRSAIKLVIKKVEVKECIKLPTFRLTVPYYKQSIEDFKKLWNPNEIILWEMNKLSWPKGTEAWGKIRIVKGR